MTKTDQLTAKDDENVVFIGKRESKLYVNTVLAQASIHDAVILKARGLNIGKAVDVALCVDRISKHMRVTETNISSMKGTRSDDDDFVSVIEIIMERS
ncbi:RNA-binding protein [candidate division TA06 bacterium]|nr:RNA-binding protein [candidate division TA06 bacterium]